MASDKSPKGLGDCLLAALTNTEISHLLDSFLQTLPPERLEQSLAQLSPDTQETVRQLLNPSKSKTSSQKTESLPISLAKLSQNWSELWQDWDAIVWEASEEDGQYIEQEAHWEPPYFDNYAFAEDLDKVAEKMQPLVQIAFEHSFTPDRGFAPALLEAEAEISGGIPEWMEIADGIELGNHVTRCLLRWEYLTAQDQGQDAFQFAQYIRQLESEFSLISMNDQALIDFLWELSEEDRRCIFIGLTDTKTSPSWQRELDNTYSPWHLFYREAINQFAPERYLDNLRTTISQRWTDGLPVIENLLAENNYVESLNVIQETLASLLASRHQESDWTPETSLLVTMVSGYYYGEVGFNNVKTLLGYFQQAEQGLGRVELSNVLKIQQIAFDSCFDWKVMFQTFTEVPISKQTYQSLFQSWREYIVRRAMPRSMIFGSSQRAQTSWIHWLIDSIADNQKGVPWFQKQITQWVMNLPKTLNTLGDTFDLLRLLTKDLQVLEDENRFSYPIFYEVVIRVSELSASDDSSRQTYLKEFAPRNLLGQVMNYWKTHLHHFVPDPRAAPKSDYTQHAKWMAALKELVPTAYETLLVQWRSDHARRSNLWKAMKKAGLAD